MDFGRSWRSKSFSSFSKYTSLMKSSPSQRVFHQRHQNITNYEPVSPIVTCMGRIKRCKKPPPPPPPPQSRRRVFHLFSISSASSYNRYSQNTTKSACACYKPKREILKVEEMDPPLPVERRKVKLCFVESLWRRRCGDKSDLVELELCRRARLPVVVPAANFGMVA